MKQLTLSRQAKFQRYAKKTRREQFLEEMDAVMPWAELLACGPSGDCMLPPNGIGDPKAAVVLN